MRLLDSALVRRVRQSPALRPAAVALYRTADRLVPARPGPRVIANSMPKSGTHLLAELLDQLDGMRFAGRLVKFNDLDLPHAEARLRELRKVVGGLRDSHFVGGHLIRDHRVEQIVLDSPVKLVTILRDPRAVVVSGAHYVLDAPQLTGRAESLRRFPDLATNLHASVHGYGEPGTPGHRPDIGVRFAQYADWAASSLGHTVRFEDLIGSQGGGSRDRQVAEVVRLLEFLELDLDAGEVEEIAQSLFSEKAITFRAGNVDSWRADLGPELESAVIDKCGETMQRLGYPV